VRDLVERLLVRAGYQVTCCADGSAAVSRAGQLRELDLLLSDIGLPGLTGPEVAGRLRSTRPGLRCLFISGYWSEEEAPRQAIAPALDVLQKPFEADELLRRVRRAIDAAG
jgi:CheY-like chemotaxis protein